jgi:hypothetical protein
MEFYLYAFAGVVGLAVVEQLKKQYTLRHVMLGCVGLVLVGNVYSLPWSLRPSTFQVRLPGYVEYFFVSIFQNLYLCSISWAARCHQLVFSRSVPSHLRFKLINITALF